MSPKLKEIQEELKTKLHRLFSAEILDKLLDNSQRQKEKSYPLKLGVTYNLGEG